MPQIVEPSRLGRGLSVACGTQPFYGQVGSRTFVPNAGINQNVHMSHTFAYIYAAVGGFFIAWPNWKVTVSGGIGEESGGLGTLTVKCAVEYPNGTFTPVTFSGGASTGSAAAGGTVWGYCPLSMPAGITLVGLRTQLSSTAQLPIITGDTGKNLTLGEALEQTVTDKTASGTITNNVVGSMFPCAIVGQTTLLSMALVGDSITFGSGNTTYDSNGNQGTISQALGRRYPHLNLGVPGESTPQVTGVKAANRIALSKYGTHVFLALGKNDLLGGGASLASDTTALVALFGSYPIRHVTMQPVTTTTDSWATTANQTVSTSYANAARLTENARRLALSANTIDPTTWEETTGSKWIVNGTANYATTDGLHPSLAADTLGVAAMAGYSLDQGTMIWMPTTPPTLS